MNIRSVRTIGVLVCTTVVLLFGAKSYAAHGLSHLLGEWSGTGLTSGQNSEIHLSWSITLGGQFIELTVDNQMTTDTGDTFGFQGVAYYKEGEADSFTGVWLDSQGDVLELRAELDGEKLTADWGTKESKFGRSIYQLLPDGTLEVSDFIGIDGELQQFGHFVLMRNGDVKKN